MKQRILSVAALLGVAAFFAVHALFARAFIGPGSSGGVGSGAIATDVLNNVAIGTSSTAVATRLLVVASSTSGSHYALRVIQPSGSTTLSLTNAGSLVVSGALTATTLAGSYTGTISSGNVSSGVFGSNVGNGIFRFPSTVAILNGASTSTLPGALTIGTIDANTYNAYGYVALAINSGATDEANIAWLPGAEQRQSLGYHEGYGGYLYTRDTGYEGGFTFYSFDQPAGSYYPTVQIYRQGDPGATYVTIGDDAVEHAGVATLNLFTDTNQYNNALSLENRSNPSRVASLRYTSNEEVQLVPARAGTGAFIIGGDGPLSLNGVNNPWGFSAAHAANVNSFQISFGDTNYKSYVNTADGYFGVQNTEPAYALDVSGSIHTNTSYVFPDNTVQTTAYTGTATIVANNVSAGTFGANTGNGNFVFPARLNVGTTTQNTYRLEVGGGASYYDGIRVTGNGASLALADNDGARDPLRFQNAFGSLYVVNATTGKTLFTVAASGAGFTVGAGNPDATYTLYGYNDTASTGVTRVRFREGAGQSTNEAFGVYANNNSTPRLVVQNGNVGVGTATPGSKFEVVTPTPGADTYSLVSKDTTYNRKVGFYWKNGGAEGGIKADSELYLTSAASIYLQPGGSTTFYTTNTGKTGIGAGNTPVNALDVFGGAVIGSLAGGYSGSATAPTNGLLVQGNVGIATTSPDAPLAVAGVIHSSTGGFRFPDGTTQTTAASGGSTISAPNVSSGAFGANTGNGNYSFPANLGVGTTTPQYALHFGVDKGARFDSSDDSGGSISYLVGPRSSFSSSSDATNFVIYSPSTGGVVNAGFQVLYEDGSTPAFSVGLNSFGAGIGTYVASNLNVGNGFYVTGTSPATSTKVFVATSTGAYTLNVNGVVYSSTGGFRFPDGTTQTTAAAGAGTVSAANISSADFGANTGGGNYSFPANLGIGDTSPLYQLTVGAGDLFGVTSSGYVRGPAGGNTVPTYSFTGDTNTGIYSAGNDLLGVAAAGVDILRITSSSLAIGTTTAGAYRLRVQGGGATYLGANNLLAVVIQPSTGNGLYLGDGGQFETGENGLYDAAGDVPLVTYLPSSNAVRVGYNGLLTVTQSGRLGVATTSPDAPLAVAGVIHSSSGGFRFPDGTTQTTAAGGGGTISAANVSSGTFGSNTGNGNYTFPAALTVTNDATINGTYLFFNALRGNGNKFVISDGGKYLNIASDARIQFDSTTGWSSADLGIRRAVYSDAVTVSTAAVEINDGTDATYKPLVASKLIAVSNSNFSNLSGTSLFLHNANGIGTSYGLSSISSGILSQFSIGTNGTTNFIIDPTGNTLVVGTSSLPTTSGLDKLLVTNGYLHIDKSGAGAPTGSDCDADAERGRFYIDTSNNRFYVCNGGTRGWDYTALTD